MTKNETRRRQSRQWSERWYTSQVVMVEKLRKLELSQVQSSEDVGSSYQKEAYGMRTRQNRINKNWVEPDPWESDCGNLLAIAESAWSDSWDVWIVLVIFLWQVPVTHSLSHAFLTRVLIKIPTLETGKALFDQDDRFDECLFRWNSTSPTI